MQDILWQNGAFWELGYVCYKIFKNKQIFLRKKNFPVIDLRRKNTKQAYPSVHAKLLPTISLFRVLFSLVLNATSDPVSITVTGKHLCNPSVLCLGKFFSSTQVLFLYLLPPFSFISSFLQPWHVLVPLFSISFLQPWHVLVPLFPISFLQPWRASWHLCFPSPLCWLAQCFTYPISPVFHPLVSFLYTSCNNDSHTSALECSLY